MPRHARIAAGGFPMHVILRGIDRTAIFFAEDDYRLFIGYPGGKERSPAMEHLGFVGLALGPFAEINID